MSDTLKVKRITFNRAPSVQRVLDAVDAWLNSDRRPLGSDRIHEVAAVMEAAIHGIRQDALPRSWDRQRHHAAACFNYIDAVRAHPAFRGHNNPPQVDINFRCQVPA